MDISNYSLFLFIITTLLFVSSTPIIGKPELKLAPDKKNTDLMTLTEADTINYYTNCMYQMGIFLLIVICTQLGLNSDMKSTQLLQYIYDYDRLSFNKEDFQKRKRVKNFVPVYDRCCAKRANDEQCTRRRKDSSEYCGTHVKGTPHGIVVENANEQQKNNTHKVEVWVQDIQGIVYYIDNSNNVYDTADIIKNQVNPKIIAKYIKNGETYSIPEFNI